MDRSIIYDALQEALEDLYNTFPEEGEYEPIDKRESIRKIEKALLLLKED